MRIGVLLSATLLLALALAPSTALAASTQTYALSCTPNSVTVTVKPNGSVSCNSGGPNESVYVVSTGSTPPQSSKTVTMVAVKCSKGSLKTFGTGASAFSCTKGGTPSATVTRIIPPVGSPGGGPGPSPGPTSNCSADNCDLISTYVNPGINLLSVIFGLIAVISIILGGIQYSTSEGDPQKASKAKDRIANTIIAIFAYALLYGFLQFLVPGGIFH